MRISVLLLDALGLYAVWWMGGKLGPIAKRMRVFVLLAMLAGIAFGAMKGAA